MKKIINVLLVTIILLTSNTSFANQVDFYWERKSTWNINTSVLNKSLDLFYKDTWLNTDIIILWKSAPCYLENNFDSCIQKMKNYSSDLLIILSMKSDIKARWDIRSLIKDEFKESITPRELKNLQDSIIWYFKNWNYTQWLKNYLEQLKELIDDKCLKIGIQNDCNAIILAKKYHNYVANLEEKKKESAQKKLIYYITLFISFVLSLFWFRKYYINNINNLNKDVRFLYMQVDSEKDIFIKDKEKLKERIKNLEKTLKSKLWDLDKNAFKLRKFYNEKKDEFLKLQNEYEEFKKYFLSQDELKNKIDKLKKIDL